MTLPDEDILHRVKILQRLNKLLALAQRGVGGEAANAERFLLKLLAKHGITMEELTETEPEAKLVFFPFADNIEKKLILQVVAKVIDQERFSHWRQGKSRKIGFKLTPADHAEVSVHLAVLVPAFRRHMKTAFAAFINTNALFPVSGESADPSEISPQELAALRAIIAATQRVTINKALPVLAET